MRTCCNDKRCSTQTSLMRIDLNSLEVSDQIFSKFITYYLPNSDPTTMEKYDGDNVFDVLRLSILYRVDRLVGYCIKFICAIDVSGIHETGIATLFDNLCNIISISAMAMVKKQTIDIGSALTLLFGRDRHKIAAHRTRENVRCFFDNRDQVAPDICERGIKRKLSQEMHGNCQNFI